MRPLPLAPAMLDDLRQVDLVVRAHMRTRSATIGAMGADIVGTPDTRLLATLVLLAAQLGEYSSERVLHVASTVELIYAATQVHDDLVDEAGRRTGSSGLHAPWNQGLPLMVGDYLFALAALEMAEVSDPRVITFFSQAVMRISEGRLTPVLLAAPLPQAEEQYLTHIGAVTGALFQAACKAGLAVVRGHDEQIEAVGRFGYDLGLAFQIVADIDDYALAGHNPGNALRRGRITLPLIYAAATGDAALTQIADSHGHDEQRIAWAMAQVRAHGTDRALATARRLRDQALSHLAIFSHTSARRALADAAHAVVPDA